jgi:hypothetical protein
VFWRRKGGDIMTSKKDLIIAILSTFCLTATLFMIRPTMSQTGQYDPWCDINDDGQIDMINDIRSVAILFGTYGDPTKNVNVTNWQPKYRIDSCKHINFSWTDWGLFMGVNRSLPVGHTEGYSRLSLQITLEKWKLGPYWTSVWLDYIAWFIEKPVGSFGCFPYYVPIKDTANATVYMNQGWYDVVSVSKPIEVSAPFYDLHFRVQPQCEEGWVVMNIYMYLRNE